MIRQPKVAPDTARKGRTTGGHHRRGNDRQRPRLSCVRFLDGLTNRALINRCARYRVSTINSPTAAAKHSLKALARRWRHLDTEVAPPTTPSSTTSPPKRRRHYETHMASEPTRRRRSSSCSATTPNGSAPKPHLAKLCGTCPIPAVFRTNQPEPSLPRRTPPSQRSAVPTSHSTNTIPPTHHRLRRSPHHRKPPPKRTSSAASNGSSPARSTKPQTVPRPRDLPTRHGRPPNPTTHRPHHLNQYLTIRTSTP